MASNDSNGRATPRIQFLMFDGCPFADAARAALERALYVCGMNAGDYELVDVLDSATPARLASWGSPTILVDGEDVTGHARGDGVGCRIYDTSERIATAESIVAAIQKSIKT